MSDEPRRRIIILGAGGRDFHVFNTRYRHDHTTEVVGFTAAQIPSIDDRLDSSRRRSRTRNR